MGGQGVSSHTSSYIPVYRLSTSIPIYPQGETHGGWGGGLSRIYPYIPGVSPMVARGAIGYIPVYPCISLLIPVVSPMAAREGYSVYPFTSLFIPYIRLRPYIPVYRQGEPHGGQGGYPIYPCISPYLRISPYILMYPVYPLEPAYPQISPYIPRVCPMAARGG